MDESMAQNYQLLPGIRWLHSVEHGRRDSARDRGKGKSSMLPAPADFFRLPTCAQPNRDVTLPCKDTLYAFASPSERDELARLCQDDDAAWRSYRTHLLDYAWFANPETRVWLIDPDQVIDSADLPGLVERVLLTMTGQRLVQLRDQPLMTIRELEERTCRSVFEWLENEERRVKTPFLRARALLQQPSLYQITIGTNPNDIRSLDVIMTDPDAQAIRYARRCGADLVCVRPLDLDGRTYP